MKLHEIEFHWITKEAQLVEAHHVKETPKQYQVKERKDSDYVARVDKDAINNIHSRWHSTPAGAMANEIARRRQMIEEREKDIALFLSQIEKIEKLRGER